MSEPVAGTPGVGADAGATAHANHDHRQPALFGCLYQPPLPRLLAGPPVARDSEVTGTGLLKPAGASAESLTPTVSHSGATRVVSASEGSTAAALGARPISPLVAVAAEFSPRYEQHRSDLVSIDLRGLARLFGSPRAIGAELRREAASRGLRVHVAVAPTRTAAMVLALTRPGVTVVPNGGVAGALAETPLMVLDQVYDEPRGAAGTRVQEQQRADAAKAMTALRGWGLRTLGELAALPAADLSARLGRSGRVWQAIARGEDTRPLVPLLADERFEGTLELDWPIEGQEPLSFVLTRLLEPLSTRLERRDRGVAVLHVALHLVTRDVHQCRLELPSPLRDVRALRTLVLLDVDAHPPAAAIDAVTITIEPTPGRILQHALFERPHPTPEQLSTLLARLGALMGQDRVGAPAQTDSFRPGAFALTPFALDHRLAHASGKGATGTSGTGTNAPGGSATGQRAGGDGNGRFVASLRGADQDLATLRLAGAAGAAQVGDEQSADGGAPPTSALRRCRQPIPARVATDGHQRPLRVFTDRRGFAGGAVVSCAGPWRTSGAWWEEDDRDVRGTVRPHADGAERDARGVRSVASVGADERRADVHAENATAGTMRVEQARGEQARGEQVRHVRSEQARGEDVRREHVRAESAAAGSSSSAGAGTRSTRKEGGGRGPWSRDEWDVALADGAVYRIFRDRTTDGWFIDAVVD